MSTAEPPCFLLFLPPVPSPPTLSSLKAAFGDTVSQVLKEVASHSPDSPKAAILEIALACPDLVESKSKPRSELYESTQKAVASIYKLICNIAARHGINVEDHDGVDARVLLVAWSPEAGASQPRIGACGPIVDLPGLAHCGRQWQYAFGVESEAGEAMVKAFVTAKGSGEQIGRVQGGPVMKNTASTTTAKQPAQGAGSHSQEAASERHYHVAVGGTFDHIHIGHKLLLTMTVFAVDEPAPGSQPQSERSATIGITGDQLLTKKKHAEVLESWPDRQQAVQSFLSSILDFSPSAPTISSRNDPGLHGRSVDLHYTNGLVVKCPEIQDPFGPTITEKQISALIISAETRSGGKAVNDKRKEKGWEALDVFEVDVLDAEDEEGATQEGFESKLSSTAIREKLAKKAGVGGRGAAL